MAGPPSKKTWSLNKKFPSKVSRWSDAPLRCNPYVYCVQFCFIIAGGVSLGFTPLLGLLAWQPIVLLVR